MFERCDFLLGEGDNVLIVIPKHLPYADTYTVSITANHIKFKAGYDSIAEMDYPGGEIFKRLSQNTQVGILEFPPGEDFPKTISNLAYIEVRSMH